MELTIINQTLLCFLHALKALNFNSSRSLLGNLHTVCMLCNKRLKLYARLQVCRDSEYNFLQIYLQYSFNNYISLKIMNDRVYIVSHRYFFLFFKVNYVLPSDVFVSVLQSLLDHDLLTVRRKALDLLSTKLQQLNAASLQPHEVCKTNFSPPHSLGRWGVFP